MKNTLLQEFISGLAVTLVGILYWVATLYQVDGVPDAYGISSRTLPFLVSFVLVLLGFMLFSMLFCGQRKRLVLVIVTLLAPLCIYFVFAKIMMIPFPITWLGY